MNLRKISVLFAILWIFSFNSLIAQTIKGRAKTFRTKSANAKNNFKGKLTRKVPTVVSLGVVNGHVAKPEDLVNPAYPSAARLLGLAGKVSIQVLINEEGKIIETKFLSGHPLLRASCLIAARRSKFTITILSGSPVQVNGIITYIFVPTSLNWLEIGYALQNKGNYSIASEQYSLKNLISLLPPDFEFEEQMLQMTLEHCENRDSIFPSIQSSIEGKLSGKPKEFWLFLLGVLLSKIEASFGNDEEAQQDPLLQLSLLLQTVPENVMPTLIIRLQKLSESLKNLALDEQNLETGNEIRQALNEILERLSFVGR